MINKLSSYIFIQILKGCTLIFFIFISIAWLLQFTRLISLTNLIQVDIITILFLSFYLLPNLISVIIPFIIMFGFVITFLKLFKDREILTIYSLGLKKNIIKTPLIYFSFLLMFISIFLNFYFAPNIYEQYKIKEFEIRNTLNFEKMIISNFLEINDKTVIDFKRNNEYFEDIFIKFSEEKDNIIYAKKGNIIEQENKFIFKLNNGFKLTLVNNDEIEKLQFENYILEIENNKFKQYDNFDINTHDIFKDIKNKNYKNISYKFFDILIILIIIIFYYINNILRYKFNLNNNLFYIFIISFLLILNQLLKNSEVNVLIYLTSLLTAILLIFFFQNLIKNKDV